MEEMTLMGGMLDYSRKICHGDYGGFKKPRLHVNAIIVLPKFPSMERGSLEHSTNIRILRSPDCCWEPWSQLWQMPVTSGSVWQYSIFWV
jgi:hypothetical protein